MTGRVGIVAVGRNEAGRLGDCLRSLQAASEFVVYVDSGSTDASVAIARSLGVRVVELDPRQPFTAARARNAGFEALVKEWPSIELVQFVDADCELVPGWIEAARKYLTARPGVAIVGGRRREVHRDASVYNRLADMEWDTPMGETDTCGGDLMVRRDIFVLVGGYEPGLIAGEDPDFCFRVRRAGGRIVRLDLEMTRHDAAISSFRQWWRRQARAGHAYVELALRHGRAPERFRLRETTSILAWGALMPVVALGAAPATGGGSLLLLGGYALLWGRIWTGRRASGDSTRTAATYATACVLAKFAGLQGIAIFGWNRWLRAKPPKLIEYKTRG